MDGGYLIGWIGLLLGIPVAPFQLYKIIKRKTSDDISVPTYAFLCGAMICYLLHAIYINSPVFIAAQAVNLTFNMIILIVILQHRRANGNK